MKITQFNVENLFLLETKDQKPIEKVKWLSKTILEISPDILMLCEVGGLESLDMFNSLYLNNLFIPFLIPGNSDRGIEIGFLIKKSFNCSYQYISHKEKNFSRDVAELRVFKNNNLELIILLVHLKSKWDREGNDPNGFLKRSNEIKELLNIYQTIQNEFPNCPIIIAGDLNGIAQKNNCEREFREIYKQTSLLDILDLLNLSEQERTTFVHFTKDGQPENCQIDYIFLPELLQNKIIKEDSGIYRYLDQHGIPLSLPQNPFERYALPSDHYPLVLTLDFLQ